MWVWEGDNRKAKKPLATHLAYLKNKYMFWKTFYLGFKIQWSFAYIFSDVILGVYKS